MGIYTKFLNYANVYFGYYKKDYIFLSVLSCI